MDQRKTKLSITKSVPSLTSDSSIITKTTINTKKPTRRTASPRLKKIPIGENKRFKEFKRNIVPNPDKRGTIFRRRYFIYEKGINYTPKGLNDRAFASVPEKVFSGLPAAKVPQLSQHIDRMTYGQAMSMTSMSSTGSRPSRMSVTRRSSVMRQSNASLGAVSFGQLSFGSLVMESDVEEEVLFSYFEKAPSMFRLRKDPSPRKKTIETDFKVTLEESETMFLLDMPSTVEVKGSEDAENLEKQNLDYEKSKYGSKTISHTATQTTRVFQKHRRIYVPSNQRVNSSAWATVWDIYDNMTPACRISLLSELSIEEGLVTHQLEADIVAEPYNDEFELAGIKFDKKLMNALMVMERLIVRETFSKQELLFQGLLLEDPLATDVKYNFSLTHLWTFSCEKTKNKKVTSICGNPANQNIIAVGYGKFKYTDDVKGLVCIWSVKNPQNPERMYELESPVTYLIFSPIRPQILAVSLYSGAVLMLDIISRSLMLKASNYHYPLYYPVWQEYFVSKAESERQQPQILITCGKNGLVYKYKKSKFFISKKIMEMARPHGNIQGVEKPKACYPRKTLLCRHPSAQVIVPHPDDPFIYIIGSAEGHVYFCSINYRHDHLDVFVAHNGPIYNIQFNPFCSKIFLTCGADWCIRIWAEGIMEPLITLESGTSPVQHALWDPLRSTVIVSITGTFIEVWDIRRRISAPKSSTTSPAKALNTVLNFSQNKYNLYLGDAAGNVHVLALTEMPFSPAFQDKVLAQSIKNMLVIRPDLVEQLEKLGSPFVSEEKTHRSRMYSKLDKLQKKPIVNSVN